MNDQFNRMKKIVAIVLMAFLAHTNVQAERIVTSFDIARWYLNSNCVFVCSVEKIDTVLVSHHDEIVSDSLRSTYDRIREVYHIRIDSTLKIDENLHDAIETIVSPIFSINQSLESSSLALNNERNTTEADTLKTVVLYNSNQGDTSSFRLQKGKKQVVIVTRTAEGFAIDYATEASAWILDLLAEVKTKGESYFN